VQNAYSRAFAGTDDIFTRNDFTREFQRALKGCLKHGFSMDEAFAFVWNETADRIPLNEDDQAELYPRLIDWAKNLGCQISK